MALRSAARSCVSGKRLAVRHAQLPLDQVQAGHHFGDRMLHLQPRVHLHQVELAVLVQQELHRAGAHVTRGLRQLHRAAAHALAQRRIDRRAGRLLDDLLVAPLHRAIALAQVDAVAVRVREYLHLDVARLEQRPLQQQLAGAESGLRLRARALHGRAAAARPAVTSRMPRPPPPAAALTITGKPMRCASAAKRCVRLVLALVARQAGHAARLRESAWRDDLLPSARMACGGGPTHTRPASIDGLREVGVLAQEAIARMHRVRAGGARRGDQLVDAQIGVRRTHCRPAHRPWWPRARAARAASASEYTATVCDAHAMRRADHPAGDLAAIRDEQAADLHCRFTTIAAAWRCP